MSLPNFTLPVSSDDPDRKLLSDISEYGWHILAINDEPDTPGYSFTVGLFYTFGHPELLIMGLKQPVAHEIMHTAVKAISTGKKFQPGETTDLLLNSYVCKFSEIDASRYQEYLGYGIWFYRSLKQPFPALQILWPDKGGEISRRRGLRSTFQTTSNKNLSVISPRPPASQNESTMAA